MQDPQTLPQMFVENSKRYGQDRIAMRKKDRGIWQNFTWKDYYDKVKFLCLGLVSMGLKQGDKVAILGENNPEVYWAELASQAAGAAAVGIFSDCGPKEVSYFLNHADIRFIFAHDQEQIDKLLEIQDEHKLEKAIYWDPKGLWGYPTQLIMPIDLALSMGQEYEKSHPGLFETLVARGRADDLAVIIFTSGTTGLPKAAMISHRALTSSALGFLNVDKYSPDDNYLSFVPVAWITEQLIGVAGSIVSGFVVNFPESAETVTENIREIGARILFFSPRQWESINRSIQSKILDTSWIKRKTYETFLPVAYRIADLKLSGKKPSFALNLFHSLGEYMVFRNLRDNLGLSWLRVGYTAGSAVSPDIMRYFHAIGVNIKQIYGSSEMGLVTAHRDGDMRPETSGCPLPGAEIRLSDTGEILVKNVGMFSGYYKDQDSYTKKFRDGWYHSGDYGYIDEKGQLIVIDRMDDLRELKGDKKFSPQYPEVRLRFSPYIKEVIVVGGEDKDSACCLINIDLDNVGRWAEAKHIAYTTFADLSQKDEVIELVRAEVERLNNTLPEEARISKFLNMVKELDADESELTRTRKLRRSYLEEKYRNLIDGLYSDQNTVEVETAIEYRDGRKGTMKRAIKICSLNSVK